MKLRGKILYAWVGGCFPYTATFYCPEYERGIFAAGESYAAARRNLIERLGTLDIPPLDERIVFDLEGLSVTHNDQQSSESRGRDDGDAPQAQPGKL